MESHHSRVGGKLHPELWGLVSKRPSLPTSGSVQMLDDSEPEDIYYQVTRPLVTRSPFMSDALGVEKSRDVRGDPLRDLVGDAEPKVIASGFAFLEGPVWLPEGFLVINDIIGDRRVRWDPDGGTCTLRTPNHMANGQAIDREGRLITCEHATSRVVRTETNGRETVLADRYEGRELNSPNDVIVDSTGRVLFTDPTYGRQAPMGVPRAPELEIRGVYEQAPDGVLRCLVADMESPNGLCLSPDERYLYVAETEHQHLRRFRRTLDGVVDEGVWAYTLDDEPVGPDGLRVDERGDVWCAGAGGVQVFDPDARLLGRIKIPETTANLTWGGDDLRTLFICASTRLYALRTLVGPGLS